jgi:hypothetical protein
MVTPVAIVLPILLSLTAIGSQFSAAVADNAGAGGLLEDISQNKLPIRYAYLLIIVVTLLLTWESNVNEIIAYASRAFALYYMFQCLVAIMVLREITVSHRGLKFISFVLLTTICAVVFALGIPSG